VGEVRQQHQQQAICGRDRRPCDLTAKDAHVLPEERVLGHQRGLRHGDVGDRSPYRCSCRRPGPSQETAMDSVQVRIHAVL